MRAWYNAGPDGTPPVSPVSAPHLALKPGGAKKSMNSITRKILRFGRLELVALMAIGVAAFLTLNLAAGPTAGDDQPAAKPADKPQDKSQEKPQDKPRERDRSERGGRPEGRPEGRPDGREGWRPRPLTDQQIEQGMAVLRETESPFLEKMQQMRESDPEQFRKSLGRFWPMLDYMVRTKTSDPDHYKLMVDDQKFNHRSWALAKQHRDATKEKKTEVAEKALADLRKVAEEHFEVRQKLRERELTELEKRLVELRKRLVERKEKRQEMIDDQIKRLTTQQRPGEF